MDSFKFAKNNNWKVCIYGLGRNGKYFGKVLPEYLGIIPDFYCDRNQEALDSYDVDYERKITFEELISLNEDVLVVVFISDKMIKDVLISFEQYKHIHAISYWEMLDNDQLICSYFGIEKPFIHKIRSNKNVNRNEKRKYSKIAVFTCITGGYDALSEPICKEKECDYFLITDAVNDDITNHSIYRKIDVAKVVPSEITSLKDQNRYCKMHGFSIFSDYDYSIYHDGSFQIIGDISKLIDSVGKMGIALHRMSECPDLYVETLCLICHGRVHKDSATYEMQKYADMGIERESGMAWGGVIVSDHRNEMAVKVMETWFNDYMDSYIKRDQIVLPYTCKKLGIDISELTTIQCSVKENGVTKQVNSHNGIQG